MLRSMFSGVSGLRSHQTMMDVVGNNIANVNTTGYKSSTVVFADTLSQLTKAAGAPQNDNGGTNPSQVGLGVRVNTIAQNFQQGSAQSTGKATDLMLNGDGMFVVKQGENTMYTRAGAFSLDKDGYLTTPEGAYVQGWQADNGGTINVNQPTGQLRIPADSVMPAEPTAASFVKGNLDNSADPVKDLTGTWKTPAVTTAFDSYDAQGTRTRITVSFINTGPGSTASAAEAKSAATDEWTVGYSWVDAAGATQTADGGTISFDPAANYAIDVSAAPNPVALSNGQATVVDLTSLTGLVGNGKSNLSATADGAAIGTLESFTFGADGILSGSYSNGLKRNLGQVAVATFNNYAGLQKAGGSLFNVSVNSGTPNVGIPGAAGRGTLGAGQLEMSNVDLSTEFTNLILAQRGFQANSKIITASDEILQDVINIKR
ncbi:flagellar hook protein FlgE [Kineosporiaceae bacterium B12]|nr:flagellar hook protein FlgE [Kineococcus rubinsiae]